MTEEEYTQYTLKWEKKVHWLYQLEINAPKDKCTNINEILGVKSNIPTISSWKFEFRYDGQGEYVDFVEYFLSILDGKYNELKKIGIKRNDIYIWFVYYFDNQCNMEFSAEQMQKLGKEGINLLISCYEIESFEEEK